MLTRFCATIRNPACSIIALIAPVRLRAVASGLMIEKVRSIAMWQVSFVRIAAWEKTARLITAAGTCGKCRRFEVPTAVAAISSRNFKSKSGTRIIFLLMPLCFRSSCQRLPRCITNFGSGALVFLRGGGKRAEQAIPGDPHGRRMAQPAHAGAISDHARTRDRAARKLRAELREAQRHVQLRRLRSAIVQVDEEIRERNRLAELQRSGSRLGRDYAGPHLRHGPHRSALQALREPPWARVRRRPAAHTPALLHQRRRPQFRTGRSQRRLTLVWHEPSVSRPPARTRCSLVPF